MSYSKDELENIHKRLQVVEQALSELGSQHFQFVKIMANESCTAYYNLLALLQRGEEIDRYRELWLKKLAEIRQEIESAETIESIAEARDKFIRDITDYVKATKVDSADKAMEVAHSFIKKYNPVALPLKAERKDDVWLVDIDVGALAVKIAKVKVDARTGDILSYEIPEKE